MERQYLSEPDYEDQGWWPNDDDDPGAFLQEHMFYPTEDIEALWWEREDAAGTDRREAALPPPLGEVASASADDGEGRLPPRSQQTEPSQSQPAAVTALPEGEPRAIGVVPPDPQPSIFADCEDEIARRIAAGADTEHYSIPLPADDDDLRDGEDPNAVPSLDLFTVKELLEMQLPKTNWIVNGLLPQGLAMLASPPKYGKSWMVLDLCRSVSLGEPFLGYETQSGGTLYLALEDSVSRLNERLQKLLGDGELPRSMNVTTQSLTLSDGLVQQLSRVLETHPGIQLVVIDTLQKIRGNAKGREGAYQYDYREMGELKRLADDYRVCVLLVHHLNKGGDDSDPHNRINGTTGILGAVDTSIVLTKSKRSEDTALMSVTGRDVETIEQGIRFDPDHCRWEPATEEGETRLKLMQAYDESPIVHTIRQLLQENSEGWKGASTQLFDACRRITGFEPATTPRRLTQILREWMGDMLMERDEIRMEVINRGTGSNLYSFTLQHSQA